MLIAVLLGGFAIMQGAPNIQYIVKGKVSGEASAGAVMIAWSTSRQLGWSRVRVHPW